MFAIRLTSPTADVVNLPNTLNFTVLRYSAEEPGGPLTCEVAVNGPIAAMQDMPSWLGYRLEILTSKGTVVWTGQLEEATFRHGAYDIGVGTVGMANAVRVEYTTESITGTVTTQITDWLEDVASIARYGRREFVERMANTNEALALGRRAAALAELSKPQKVIRLGQRQFGGSLRGRGLWFSYDWVKYVNDQGLVAHASGTSAAQPLGLGFTASDIGFDAQNYGLHTLGGQVRYLSAGYRLRVAGSPGNSAAFTVEAGTSQLAQSYTAATISFGLDEDGEESPGEIRDSANGLGFINANDLVQIAGAVEAGNNRYTWVASGTADGSQVNIDYGQSTEDTGDDNPLTEEAAGASVTLNRANSVRLAEAVVQELPGASVTVTVEGMRIAQSFQNPSSEGWTAAEVYIRLRKIGAPADNVVVELCADSAGVPGTVLDSASVAGGLIADQGAWLHFTLSNTVLLAPGTTYWLVVRRSGANDWANFYLVDVSPELGYSEGLLLVWDGVTWVTRTPDADLLFRVLGATPTTTQMREMAESAGWQIAGVQIDDASGINVNQHRSGDKSTLDELTKLLQAGTASGELLQAWITPDRILRIRQRPTTNPESDLIYTADGRLLYPNGREIEPGILPVGQWINLSGGLALADMLATVAPFYCRRVEYDALAGQLVPELALQSVFEVGGISL